MALSPRTSGKTAARDQHSPATWAVLSKIEPFFASSEVSGGPMLIATLIALFCYNLPFGSAFAHFWSTDVSIAIGTIEIERSLAEWIDDALLPLFFVIVVAEVKREIVVGELSQWRTASLPLFGSLGGMLVPVALFVAINWHTGGFEGWGTVVATDTAFGLAMVAIFGRGLPPGVRALMLAFAAIDDVGALAVIAAAYTSHFQLAALLVAVVCSLRHRPVRHEDSFDRAGSPGICKATRRNHRSERRCRSQHPRPFYTNASPVGLSYLRAFAIHEFRQAGCRASTRPALATRPCGPTGWRRDPGVGLAGTGERGYCPENMKRTLSPPDFSELVSAASQLPTWLARAIGKGAYGSGPSQP